MTNDFPLRSLSAATKAMAISAGATLSLLIATTNVANAAEPAEPAAPQIEILETRSAGTGCPDGTVNGSLSPDGSAISLLYDQLSVQAGGAGANEGDQVVKSAKCAVRLKFKVPKGWTVGISKVENRGFVNIPDGMSALFWTRVKNDKFSPVGPVYGYQYWEDETSEDFSLEATADRKPAVHECRSNNDEVATIRLDNHLWVWGEASAQEGTLIADSTDGVIKQNYRLKLQRCRPVRPSWSWWWLKWLRAHT